MRVRDVKDINRLLLKLDLVCKLCSQEKAIIIDRSKGSVPIHTLGSDGKVVICYAYPARNHPLYCPHHLDLKGGD